MIRCRLNDSTEAVDRIEFHLTRPSDRTSVHAYRKVDDLHDGSYLFRYRLYESVENLHLYIRFGSEEIERTVQGYLYSDGCYCPENNRTRWFEALECPSAGATAELRHSFQVFDQIDMKQVIQKAKGKYFQHQQSYALCHYVVKNNKVGADGQLNRTLLARNRSIENVTVNTSASGHSRTRFFSRYLER